MPSPTPPTQQTAYVVHPDGVGNAVPVNFVGVPTGQRAESMSSFSFSNKGTHYAAPTPESDQSMHWGRRIVGIILIVLGIPMLILPGPGIFAIGFGLFLLLKR